jgi:hypothetical protein
MDALGTTEELRERVKRVSERNDLSRGVLAQLSGVDEPRMSKFMSGLLTLPTASPRIALALQFVETLAARSKLPICFHNWARLRPLWIEYQKKR